MSFRNPGATYAELTATLNAAIDKSRRAIAALEAQEKYLRRRLRALSPRRDVAPAHHDWIFVLLMLGMVICRVVAFLLCLAWSVGLASLYLYMPKRPTAGWVEPAARSQATRRPANAPTPRLQLGCAPPQDARPGRQRVPNRGERLLLSSSVLRDRSSTLDCFSEASSIGGAYGP